MRWAAPRRRWRGGAPCLHPPGAPDCRGPPRPVCGPVRAGPRGSRLREDHGRRPMARPGRAGSTAWLTATQQHDDPVVLLADLVRLLDEFEPLGTSRPTAAVVRVRRLQQRDAPSPGRRSECACSTIRTGDRRRAPASAPSELASAADAGRKCSCWLTGRADLPDGAQIGARSDANRSPCAYGDNGSAGTGPGRDRGARRRVRYHAPGGPHR